MVTLTWLPASAGKLTGTVVVDALGPPVSDRDRRQVHHPAAGLGADGQPGRERVAAVVDELEVEVIDGRSAC